jgi:hypothetical protein
MHSPLPLVLAALAAASVLGCIQISTYPSPSTTPEVGAPLWAVEVDYAATSDGDVVAPAPDVPAFPIAAAGLSIARDATFRLSPIDRRETPGAVVLVPADAAGLAVAPDGRAHATREGDEGVFVQGLDGVVVDFVNLSIRAVASVVIEAAGPLPSRVGDTTMLAARSLDEAGVRLAGSVPYAWRSSDASIVELVEGEPGSRVRVIARAPGRAKISAAGQDVATALDLEVLP